MENNRPLGWTTLEEAKLLIEAGLNPNTADMCYLSYKDFDDKDFRVYGVNARAYREMRRETKEFDYVPCWSLGALENILPLEIKTSEGWQNEYELLYRKNKFCEDSKECFYQLAYGNNRGLSMEWHDMINTAERDTMIEAVCDMLCWLLKNGYIKKQE